MAWKIFTLFVLKKFIIFTHKSIITYFMQSSKKRMHKSVCQWFLWKNCGILSRHVCLEYHGYSDHVSGNSQRPDQEGLEEKR